MLLHSDSSALEASLESFSGNHPWLLIVILNVPVLRGLSRKVFCPLPFVNYIFDKGDDIEQILSSTIPKWKQEFLEHSVYEGCDKMTLGMGFVA